MSRSDAAAWALRRGLRALGDLVPRPVDPRDVAICTIHGNTEAYGGQFARRYAWPQLQLRMLREHTPPGYVVLAYGNRLLAEHEEILRGAPEVRFVSSRDVVCGEMEHVWPLRNYLGRMVRDFRYIVHLDSDAFPVRDDWLPRYARSLHWWRPVVAVQRLENGDRHSDRCFTMFRQVDMRRHGFDFSVVGVRDAGAGISDGLERQGLGWRALRRTNAHDYHPLISGIYDDRIYHHAAGSRLPRFRLNLAQEADENAMRREGVVHTLLMERLFDDTEGFLAELRGQREPFDLEAEVEKRLTTGERSHEAG